MKKFIGLVAMLAACNANAVHWVDIGMKDLYKDQPGSIVSEQIDIDDVVTIEKTVTYFLKFNISDDSHFVTKMVLSCDKNRTSETLSGLTSYDKSGMIVKQGKPNLVSRELSPVGEYFCKLNNAQGE